jgi:hypothetical protein
MRKEMKMKHSATLTYGTAALLMLLAVGDGIGARADDSAAAVPAKDSSNESIPWEKGVLQGGGFLATMSSKLTFGTEGAGVTLDAENLLGLESTLRVWRVDAIYRPGKSRRQQLDFTYLGFNREAQTQLTQQIEIDNTILLPGTQLKSVFDFDIYRLTYSYALIQDNRMRIAIGLGIYVVPIHYGLDIFTSGQTQTLDVEEVTLPLPSLALRMDFQLVPKLFLKADINAMYLKISNFEGSLLDTTIGLEYQPWKHFGLGLAYNPFSVHVQSSGSSSDYPGANFIGAVDVDYSGLLLYGKVSF